ARAIGRAGPALATHVWRNAAAGNLGGWQVARALELIVVLMGAVATPGGTAPSAWHKAVPEDRKSTRLNSSHGSNSYAVFCLKTKTPMLGDGNARPHAWPQYRSRRDASLRPPAPGSKAPVARHRLP